MAETLTSPKTSIQIGFQDEIPLVASSHPCFMVAMSDWMIPFGKFGTKASAVFFLLSLGNVGGPLPLLWPSRRGTHCGDRMCTIRLQAGYPTANNGSKALVHPPLVGRGKSKEIFPNVVDKKCFFSEDLANVCCRDL